MTYSLQDALQNRILILDGAMGTMIQNANLSPEDWEKEDYEGCNEYLNLIKPELITSIHEKYLQAGSDIIETNTFGGAPFVLDEFSLGSLAYEINKQGAILAKNACLKYSTDDKPRFAVGAIGPTTKMLSVTGGITFDKLAEEYYLQVIGLIDGGVDALLIETSQDLRNVKACHHGILKAFSERNMTIPIMISGTIEPMGTTLAGQTIEAFYYSVKHMNPISVGLNCATGPEFMTDHLRTLASIATCAVSCYPNAGLPDENGHYHESPESLSKKLSEFINKGWLNIIGGCCGTTPEHIKAISETIKDFEPRILQKEDFTHAVSGLEAIIYDDSMRPLFVGERSNVIGSRLFKNLIVDEKYEEAAEIAREQVKKGAAVIDVCLANPDRDEKEDMIFFLEKLINKTKVPLMIDSTDEDVIVEALKLTQGKSIINSINLEDGLERFDKIVPLANEYGAAFVVGTIDEVGMGVSVERKLEIAQKSFDILTKDYGVLPSDIIFDPLVFPIGTGDKQYTHSAKETIEGVKAIKEAFPHCLTILGVSNVSFGLPAHGREVLNSVFLYHCTKNGLDYAIVNTEKLERFASIPAEEIALCEELLFNNSDEALEAFTNFYRVKVKTEAVNLSSLTLEERLANYIVEGKKIGLIEDLESALQKYESPLEIINGPLMDGMNTVGKLFNENQLIVAEVLQSAEAMKTAVSFLEPHMESTESSSKGKMIIATVKGDVHDIGKNLVDIIMSNNGFDVIDLGIKVAPATLIEAIRREKPDIIGLSGLLVKSAQQMVLTAIDFKEANITTPILVGGAALTRKFTNTKIAPNYNGSVNYAKDAMDGLRIANELHQNGFESIPNHSALLETELTIEPITEPIEKPVIPASSSVVANTVVIPKDTKPHYVKNYPFSIVDRYINEQMLIGHHLGLKGKINDLLEKNDEKATKLYSLIQDLKQYVQNDNIFELNSVFQFFPCKKENDTIHILSENCEEIIESFTFPRQQKEPFLCLADYIHPTEIDYIGMFVVTVQGEAFNISKTLKDEGEYFKSHALLSLALETAEAFAERTHQIMRDSWGISDSVDITIKDLFRTRYTGQRFSFGYPACPNLEDQKKLFKLLQPEKVGVTLSDGFMMSPESSVSAIVLSHPDARYFSV